VIQTHARKAQASENQARRNDGSWRRRVLIWTSEEHQKNIHRWFWAPEETHINRHVRRTSEEPQYFLWAPEETSINRHVRRTSEERQYFLWAPEETSINRHVRRTSPDKTDGFGLRRRLLLIGMSEGHQKNVNISCGLRRRLLLIGMSEGHHQIKPMVLGSGGDSY
jgi:Fe2+ transport system protein FeoA